MNQQLLAHLRQEKPAQSSEREVSIKFVSDSLCATPAEQYKQLTAVLQLPEQSQQYHQQAPQSQQYQQQAPQYQLFQQSRPSKKRKRGEQEEEWMKDLRETMKVNQQLLAHVMQEKPAQSSEREVSIKFVSDSLRAAPAEQYKQLKIRFSALLDADSQQTLAPQSARPAQATSAPPVLQLPEQYQQSQQYQQQAPQSQQYQQQAPQYQLFQQRLSASTFTNLLNTSQDVLDGSINLSGFSVDSQLNTPPPPPHEKKDQAEKGGDSD